MSLKILKLFFYLILPVVLASCVVKQNNHIPITTQEQLEEVIKACHRAKVIQRGEYLKLILYKDLFFKPNTTKLKESAFKELDLIAELLNHTGTGVIVISGHSDNVKSEKVRLAESDIIARNIASYLWSKGVHFERMRVYGLGDIQPIGEDSTPFGSSYNRRVEIQLPFSPSCRSKPKPRFFTFPWRNGS